VALARYQEVVRLPHVARLLVTSIVARLPQGMSGLAILLLLSPTVGYARAGLATGISVAAAGVSNVLLARAVDRCGARRVLLPAAALYAGAMVGLAVVAPRAYGVEIVMCVVIGLVTPPISAVSRGLWPQILDEEHTQAVYGLEATVQELIFIAGPAAVALIAGLASAQVAVVVSGLLGLLGTVAYVSAPPFADVSPPAADGVRRQVLFGTGVLRYAMVGTCITLGFGMAEIATVDFVSGSQATAAAGIVIAVWSVGSLLGGLWFGVASERVTDRTLASVIAVIGCGIAAAALAPDAVGLAVILFVSGVAVAPTLARLYTRMGMVAPDASKTEAFGWMAVGFLIGSSLGSTLGGVSVDGIGPRWTFVLAGMAAWCGIAVVTIRRPVASWRGR
jgi:MFS family permease